MQQKLCSSWYKKGQNVYKYVPGKKWARFEKEYLPYDWSYDAKIWMADVQGGDLSARKCFFT